ncbi:hypothetical protein L1049_008294 [Liquidambar formosana]|uniref:U-box domain-containing protein 12 n=1 Tax=Liquidambar formosana TaxID=63359 RepID=A0AAP0S5Y0_LIQFO
MDDEKAELLEKLMDIVEEISHISNFKCVIKKQSCNLSRRVKLLIPLFEELGEIRERISVETLQALISLKEALESAKQLLRACCQGSNIFLAVYWSYVLVEILEPSFFIWLQVLERERTKNKFQKVTVQFEQALGEVSYDKLDISDEVKEQVELVHAQFRRGKEQIDSYDWELYEDLLSIYNQSNDVDTGPAVLSKLCEKLQLLSTEDVKQESLAVHEMAAASGGEMGESMEKVTILLRKIEDFVQAENPHISISVSENDASLSCSGQAHIDRNSKSPGIPDDFRCPISLDLMKDPVIISTGQTYERACIKKWLEAGHGTCPKTQQILHSSTLTPNYVLRSLISHWCEASGMEPPKRPGNSRFGETTFTCSAKGEEINTFLSKLASDSIEDQRSAAGELRRLAKHNGDNRVFIAEVGAIPLLVSLLFTPDSCTQEHAVTALLNLSICEDNKGSIMSSGAVPGILHVLQNGSMEARENAAATFFSLSVVDEFKVIIGSSGAIPALVTLLNEGSQRGKLDAAMALFNLCIYQGNKGKAVRAGVVPMLMTLLTKPDGEMVDEALAIMAILASHPDGRAAIGALEVVPVLVELIGNGSPRNRENAAAVLVHLCAGDHQCRTQAWVLGVMDPLLHLADNGTDRGKRKATQLLELMGRFVEQHEQSQMQADAQPQN